MPENAPLIVTLKMDAESFSFFDKLRQRHFPQERNFLLAHLTLFHHLPGSERSSIENTLHALCLQQEQLTLNVTEVKSMGRGVAYKQESATLVALHQRLQRQWQEWLTQQDQQKLWPHVTVQNKVTPVQAAQLLQELTAPFIPFEITGLGLQLWEYQGGPWELLHEFLFGG